MIGPVLLLLCDGWTLLILDESLRGTTRFSDWRTQLDIPNSVLSDRLKQLVAANVLSHGPNDSAHYQLTNQGEQVWQFVAALHGWQSRWRLAPTTPATPSTPRLWHSRCRRPCAPRLSCTCSPHPVAARDLAVASQRLYVPRPRDGNGTDGQPRGGRARNKAVTAAHSVLHPTTLTALGSRWSAEILVAALWGATRFTEFAAWLGIPPAILSARLREFTASGLLTLSDTTQPVRGAPKYANLHAPVVTAKARKNYVLTEKGLELFEPLIIAADWDHTWLKHDNGFNVSLRHNRCGRILTPVLRCTNCHATLRRKELTFLR